MLTSPRSFYSDNRSRSAQTWFNLLPFQKGNTKTFAYSKFVGTVKISLPHGWIKISTGTERKYVAFNENPPLTPFQGETLELNFRDNNFPYRLT